MTASHHPLLLPWQRDRRATLQARPALACVSGQGHLFPPSPWDGGHGDAGLSVQLGPVAEARCQPAKVGFVNQSASFQAAQLRFLSDPIFQPPTGEEVRNRALDPCLLVLHVMPVPSVRSPSP